MRGVPIGPAGAHGLPWITVPQPGSRDAPMAINIDRERLRESEYAFRAVRRRFPKALGLVVGDVAIWATKIETQLNIVKGVVQRGATFPSLARLAAHAALRPSTIALTETLARLHPVLGPVLLGLVWLNWHDEAELRANLDAMDVDAVKAILGRFEKSDGVLTAIRLTQMSGDGLRPRLLQLIGEFALLEFALHWQCTRT